MTVDGAVVLVTGAGSGIGRATALAFAALGAQVVSTDIDPASAEKTAADCGGRAYRLDVSDRGDVDRVTEDMRSGVGVADILVNNAGVGLTGRFNDTGLPDWDWIVGINLMGAVNLCHAVGPAMVARGSGHVVNVSSGLAYMPRSTESAYVTTKAAILALSHCLRADWHTAGVGVSAVCPGIIDTDIIRGNTRFAGDRSTPESRAKVERLFARGHRPELVADAIVDAVRRDRAVVPVGFESRLGWAARRVVPQAGLDLLSRLGGDHL